MAAIAKLQLKNVELMWARLAKPSDMDGKYQVQLVKLDKAQVKELEKHGLEVRDGKTKAKPDPSIGRYVNAKAKPYDNGACPVVLKDAACNVLENAENIGNGTKANVNVTLFEYDYKGKQGIGVGLDAVQIVDLVEFNNNTSFDPVDGYTVATVAAGADVDPWADDDVPN